ncbi:MAG: NAD-dependent epimerase/dehydratase family protein [Planctomycetota bacterium]
MKTAYVTGATGCVGRNLVDELLKDGWRVIALHRRSSDLSRLAGCPVEFQEVDLHDPASVTRALRLDADAIFHVAANLSHGAAEAGAQWRDNVLATRHLIEVTLRKPGIRFIFTSTGAVLPYQHLDEARVTRIGNGYIRTKRQAELEVERGIRRGLDAVILRPIIVFGAYDYNSYSQIFSVLQNGRLRPCFPGRINFCHAADVARGHIQAFERGRRGEYYVLSGPYTTWYEAFREICACLRVGKPVAIPQWVLKPASHILAFGGWLTRKKPVLTPDLVDLVKDFPDISDYEKRKAWTDLGYTSRSLAVMIEDCYEWLVREGMIREGRPVTRRVRPDLGFAKETSACRPDGIRNGNRLAVFITGK